MRAIRGLLIVAWTALNLVWLRSDQLIRDGDEEGHVGAAELFRQQLENHDLIAFFTDAWMGRMGEYPPLYAATVGGWWWLTGAGQPGTVAVRSINLFWPIVAALSVGALARRLSDARGPAKAGEIAATAAVAVVLAAPLVTGLGRHFMPEGMLIAAVAGAVAVAAWAAEAPSPKRALALGAVVGAGLLVKQTFVLVAVLPVLVAGWRLGWRWALVIAGASATAGPWLVRNWAAQAEYGAASLSGTGDLLAHTAYYPWALTAVVLGPIIAAGTALSAFLLVREGRPRPALMIGAAWLVGGAVVLSVVPRKYPRLAAPLAPAAGLLVGVALSRTRRWVPALGAGTALSWGWLTVVSVSAVPTSSPPAGAIDKKCPQIWVRPPVALDFGLEAVADALRPLPDGPLWVESGPAIPCSLQTTHDWPHHLSPYLRRDGNEREVVQTGPAVARVTWTPGPPALGSIPVPALGGAFAIQHLDLAPDPDHR